MAITLYIEYILYILLTTLCFLLTAIFVYYKRAFTFWNKRGVYNPTPSIPFGNVGASIMYQSSLAETLRKLYVQCKSIGVKHCGLYFFTTPVYFATDLDVMKSILQADSAHFVDHGDYSDDVHDPLGAHLFSLEGEEWKKMRAKLTPTFTAGKIRTMFHNFLECSNRLQFVIDQMVKNDVPMNVKEMYTRFFTDVIASCAFGIDANTMKEEQSEFIRYGNVALEPAPEEVVRNLKLLIQFVIPHSILKKCRFRLTRRDVEEFFVGLVRKIITYRNENDVKRADLMQLLMELRHDGSGGITMNQLAAQCLGFFFASVETSSGANAFAMYELAKNQDVQNKLRAEIKAILDKHDGQFTYEAVAEMKYLEQVLCETLRKYPVAATVTRVCNKQYTIPGSSLTLEEGTKVFIPTFGIHRDPEYYPNPDVFDPERFGEEEKRSRHPFTWIPFGGGARKCLGTKFAMLETKVGLVAILKDHQVSLNEKTQEPLQFDTHGFLLKTKDHIWVDLKRVD